MKRIKILLILFVFPLALFSQGREVTGNVSDENGEALIGANVIIKGTTSGSITDVDGNFSLTVPDPEEAVLVFSYIGFLTQEIPVGNSTVIDVVLAAETIGLDEVVITALGINRDAKSLVYARQGVDAEDLKEVRSTNVLNSLSGRAAGVQVINSGTPSGSNRVVIRGITSLVGSNQPLYVVDGVPLDNSVGDAKVGTWTNDNEQLDFGDPLSQMNPDDIENIEILKGANASALYGSRAANGVILITTKKGTEDNGWGVSIISNTVYTEFSQLPENQYVYGSGAGGSVAWSAQQIDPVTGLPNVNRSSQAYGSPLLGFDVLDFNGQVGPYLAQTNNVTDLYKPAWSFTNGLSIDKAGEKGTIRASYTNTTSNWMMEGQEEIRRHNVTFRGTRNINDKFDLDASVLYTHENVTNRVSNAGSVRNPALSIVHQHPNQGPDNLVPWKDESGQAPGTQLFWFTNPYWLLNEVSNGDGTDRVIGNVTLNYEVIEGLNLRGRMMGDVRLIHGYEFHNMGAAYDRDGLYRNFNQRSYNWNFEGIATYFKKFGDISLNAMAGGNAYIRDYERRQADLNTLLLPDVASSTNNGDVALVNKVNSKKQINSVFGSATVGWRDIVFVDVTARNDWSSTLPESNNSYFYPSIGSSFIFSELLPESDAFSYGKARVSWAKVGNDAGPYQIYNTYNYVGLYDGMPHTAPGRTYKNPDLKNEETNSFEIGLEAGFVQNRITVNLSYYNTSSVNQIIQVGITPAAGYNNRVYNAGEITNKGIEVIVGGKILTGAFQWDLTLNWSNNKSMVESLYPGIDRYQLNRLHNATTFAEVGQPFGVIYGPKQVTDSITGKGLVNENGIQVFEHGQYIGKIEPDWIGGISNSFRWKGFNLNFLIDIRKGGMFNSWTTYRQGQFGIGEFSLGGRDEYLMSARILGETNNERKGIGLYDNPYARGDRAQGSLYPGVIVQADGTQIDNNVYIDPATYYFQSLNDIPRITHDATYVKLRELILGYSLPASVLSKTPFQGLRLSLVARNPFILYQKTPKGLDPEAHTNSLNGGVGLEFGSFLPSRSYGFNINISF